MALPTSKKAGGREEGRSGRNVVSLFGSGKENYILLWRKVL